MIVDASTRFRLFQESAHHCSIVWPAILEYKFGRDITVLDEANRYLGDLKSSDELVYNIVMEMLSKRSGADWVAIRDAVS